MELSAYWYIWLAALGISFLINWTSWKGKYSKLPTPKLRFFNFWGHFSYLLWIRLAPRTYPKNVYATQILGGISKLFSEKKIALLWMGPLPRVLLLKPEAVEQVFLKAKSVSKSDVYQWTVPILGKGLVISETTKWKRERKILEPYFVTSTFEGFLPIFNRKCKLLVDELSKETQNDFTDISPRISDWAFSTVYEIIFGIQEDHKTDEKCLFEKLIKRMIEMMMERILNVFHFIDFIYKYTKRGKEFAKHQLALETLLANIIKKKKAQYIRNMQEEDRTGDSKQKYLIDLILYHHLETQHFNEKDVSDHAINFLVAGFDTSYMTIVWGLYLIGHDNVVQEKIYHELECIFGNDFQRPITREDLNHMIYLEAAIKETLRLFAPVTFVGRTTEVDIKIDDYVIPKGTNTFVSPYFLHRDEESFPDAEKFNPDRFLPENSVGRHRCAFVPFATGARNCIGKRMAMMELKCFLASLLRRFRFESLDPRDKLLTSMHISYNPSGPVRMRIRERHPYTDLRRRSSYGL